MADFEHVRLIHDLTQVGFLTGKERPRGPRRMLQVRFASGTRWVDEDQLEVAEERLDPLDMLERGKLTRPADLRRTLTHVKLSGRMADVIYSMEATNTDFYAFQFKPVVKILESPTNALLIADEVGLGKTIEAGLVWTELRSRFDMRRLLILCPATLREKWRMELSRKMGVVAEVCDARRVLEVLQDTETHHRGFALIASMQGLRPPSGWDSEEEVSTNAAKLARFLAEMEVEEPIVDLLVVDEAHHLRNSETQTNRLGRLCRNVADYTVLLSATPIHNGSDDLLSLLRLLDPDTFTRREVLSEITEANKPLLRARDMVLRGNAEVSQVRNKVAEAKSHPLLRSSRQLKWIEDELREPDVLRDRQRRSRLAHRLETANLLAHVITRTRKRDVTEGRVVRRPESLFVELNEHEAKFYDLVTELVVRYSLRSKASDRFLLAQPQRQMTSSMPAALRAWQRRSLLIEEAELNDTSDDAAREKRLGPIVAEIVSRLDELPDLDTLVEHDGKYGKLRDALLQYFDKARDQKVVVFSSFRATLHYLAERLQQDGISTIQLMGGVGPKDEVIRAFEDPDGPRVLLSSEVGGEGVDLQFSRVVVNYDLPWNPMRVEQRIGRVDRLGQKADSIAIWNILYDDTIDARVYRRLYDKLRLCEEALGDFEAILGNEIRTMSVDLLAGELSPEQQEERIDQTAQALENLRQEEYRLEENAASLIAHGDYILNQVQEARELNRWINDSDLRYYVEDHLSLHYPGSVLRALPRGQYELALSNEAKVALASFMKEERVAQTTRLIEGLEVRCVFGPTFSSSRARHEAISQFHPLVRMISKEVREKVSDITPAVAASLACADVGKEAEPGIYVVAVALWSFRGLQRVERLAYSAARLEEPDERLPDEFAERLTSAVAAHGRDWLEAPNSVDLVKVHDIANNLLFAHLADAFHTAGDEVDARNQDRADVQQATAESHLSRQTGKLKQRIEILKSSDKTKVIPAMEGQLRALESRMKQRLLTIEDGRELEMTTRDIAVAVVKLT